MKWKDDQTIQSNFFTNEESELGVREPGSKKEGYYYYRRPPAHSAIPIQPFDHHGPPPNVAPYYYYTDKDLEIVHGKDDRKTITTLSRPTDQNMDSRVTKRVATSPLKSSIQNAEVKISRGGVAISFDPWKAQAKNKANQYMPYHQEPVAHKDFDHIANQDELRLADAEFSMYASGQFDRGIPFLIFSF